MKTVLYTCDQCKRVEQNKPDYSIGIHFADKDELKISILSESILEEGIHICGNECLMKILSSLVDRTYITGETIKL